MAPDGVITNDTERSMYHALHANADEFRHDYAFIARRTRYARAAVSRWVADGVLECQQVPWAAGSHAHWTAYRLAPAYRDPELIDADLATRQARLNADRARMHSEDARSVVALDDAWRALRARAAKCTCPTDGDLDDIQELTRAVNRALSLRQSVLAEQQRIAQADTDLQRDTHAWAQQPLAEIDGECDPLAGDA